MQPDSRRADAMYWKRQGLHKKSIYELISSLSSFPGLK